MTIAASNDDWNEGFKKMIGTPNPGSIAAIEMGCTCPVLDNNHGEGVNGEFWMAANCPLHGFKEENGTQDVPS